jgi:2-keto-4-pentenoate hydratase
MWSAALDGGAQRIGWKIGFNVPAIQEKLGIAESVVGHLTTATMLPDDAEFSPRAAGDLRAELEVAIQIGDDGGVAGYAPAIELVDLADPPDGVEAMIEQNIFHRAFAVGPLVAEPPDGSAFLTVNEEAHEAVNPFPDFEDTAALVARRLEAAGQQLKAGDLIITGALVVVPVKSGDGLTADIDRLGTVTLTIA